MMSIKYLYVAGPMTGYKNFNFPAFFSAQQRLEAMGYIVYNPAEEDVKSGFDPINSEVEEPDELALRKLIQHDIHLILWNVDAIVLLPGWEHSKGSAVEIALAKFLSMPVYELDDMLNNHV